MSKIYDDIIEYNRAGKPLSMRNDIALKHYKLVYWALNSWGLRRYKVIETNKNDYDEFLQEAFIRLLNCIESFDIDSKYSFTNYYRYSVGRLIREIQEYNKDVSLDSPIQNNDESLTMQDVIEDDSDDIKYFDEEVEHRDYIERIRKIIKDELNEYELKIIYDYFQHEKTLNEIAEDHNLRYGKIHNDIHKIKYKLGRNLKLRELYSDYNEIKLFNSGSVLEYKAKSNGINDITFQAVAKRIDIKNKIDNHINKIISETVIRDELKKSKKSM